MSVHTSTTRLLCDSARSGYSYLHLVQGRSAELFEQAVTVDTAFDSPSNPVTISARSPTVPPTITRREAPTAAPAYGIKPPTKQLPPKHRKIGHSTPTSQEQIYESGPIPLPINTPISHPTNFTWEKEKENPGNNPKEKGRKKEAENNSGRHF